TMQNSLFSKVKDRTQLDKQMKKFIDKGGVVQEIPNDEYQDKKRREIAKVLHFSVHHRFYARKTGLSVQRIKEINKNIQLMTDEETEKLWSFIKDRREIV
ncbi:hypothetical protein PJ364_003520, partial [Acinetobacter baumannii]